MALRGKKPEKVKESKPKFIISGKSGVGKTYFALDFPNPYIIDTEGGALRPQYIEKIQKNGGCYFGKEEGSQDFKLVINEVKELVSNKHDYKTLIIDSFTYLYLLEAAQAEENGGSDFGRDKKEANKPTRQLIRWIEKLDMTVILICHAKEKWRRVGKEVISDGTTYDGYDKLEFMLDLWIEVEKKGVNRFYTVKKSRIDAFKENEHYPLEYKKFCELYGNDIITRPISIIEIATKAQLDEIQKMLEVVKIPQDEIDKWFSKNQIESWEELNKEQAFNWLKYLNDKIKNVTGGEK
jgi:RecA/RadA recombinase